MGRLLDDWHSSRQVRTNMVNGERQGSVEAEIDGDSSFGRWPDWVNRLFDGVDKERHLREPERDKEVGS